MSEQTNNTTDTPLYDELEELEKTIKSGAQSSEELQKAIDKFVGLYLKQKDEGLVSIDHQKELEDLLGEQHSDLIRSAQSNYYNGKAQCSSDSSKYSVHSAADPVMMFNGQFIHTVQDIKIDGAGIDFVFTRTYKNQSYYNGPLGFNWDYNYNLWLREEGQTIVCSSGELREDRYIKHTIYNDHYVPPDGYYNVIEPYRNSFVLRSYNGTRFIYEQIDNTNLHRIKRIQDRNSNYLSFSYDDQGRLKTIEINNRDRKVEFQYDDYDRIIKIRAYAVTYKKRNGIVKVKRVWHYTYDDYGDLVKVTTPATDDYPKGLSTYYGYSSSSFTGELMHNLLRIIDPEGQLYLENEFGIQKGLLSYNRVIRQRQGKGEYYLEYTDIIPQQSWNYSPEEMPAHRTILCQRNGHPVEHIYNKFGNLIVKKEKILQGCSIKELISRYRYDKDGKVIGSLSPEGSIVQYYYGREDFYRRLSRPGNINAEPWKDPNLPKQERLKFGNLLALVKRGKYYTISQLNLNRGLYGDFFPSIIARSNNDIIIKYTYEPEYQQIASVSDPRYTKSARPGRGEDSNYRRHLTKYEYYPSRAKNLKLIKYPDTTFPSRLPNGTDGLRDIKEEYLGYDSHGRIRKVKDPEGSVTEYRYFLPQAGTTYKSREGYLQKQILDASNLQITTSYEVNEAGITTSIIKPEGSPTEYRVNELNQTIETTPLSRPGFRTKYFFDKNNLLEWKERENFDDNGRRFPDGSEITTFKYDQQGNLIRESIGGSDLSKHLVTQHFYNSSDKKIKTILPRGNEIHYDYDERLLINKVTRGACTIFSSTITTLHDGNERKIKFIDGLDNVTRYKYDAFDRLIAVIDALGNIKQTEYDKLGNVLVERFFEKRSDRKYYLVSRQAYEYDSRGNKIRQISYIFEKALPTKDYDKNPDSEFNAARAKGLVKYAENQYFYDRKRRLFKIINAKGYETKYEYDGLDRKTKEVDALGNYTVFIYDKNSNVTRIDNHERILNPQTGRFVKEVFSTIKKFDKLDREIESIDNLGNKTEFRYDSRNNLVMVTDALGNVRKYQYDIFGRKVKEILKTTKTGIGGGAHLQDIVTKYGFDENGNLISIIDPREVETKYNYDPLDRLSNVIYPDHTSYEELQYDAANNVISVKDCNGLKMLYFYDALNRKIRMDLDKTASRYPYPSDAEDFEEYEIDGLGRILLQRNNFCTIQSRFDSLNRSYREDVKFNASAAFPAPTRVFTIKRSFDNISNLRRLTYPSGRVIECTYNEINKIKRIVNKKNGKQSPYGASSSLGSTYDISDYDYAGRRLSKTLYGNKAEYRVSYDGLARIISISNLDSSARRVLEIQQLYDGMGNKRFETSMNNGRRFVSEHYKYDSVYRLTRYENKNTRPFNPGNYKPPKKALDEKDLDGQKVINNAIGSLAQNGRDLIYQYDKCGNWIKVKRPTRPAIIYKTNLLNQYIKAGRKKLAYDLNGNLINDGSNKYFYNYRNQLVKVQPATNINDLIKITYDSFGRSIHTEERGNDIYLINNALDVIEEYQAERVSSQYVYEGLADQRCQMINNFGIFWYHFDIVRSTRLLTDEHGKVSQGTSYSYDPFGSLRTAPNRTNPYLFTGKRWLSSIGTYDFRARIYDPDIGRFLQRDPKGYVDGPNPYTYAGNNPLSFFDILGTEKTQRESWDDRITTVDRHDLLTQKAQSMPAQSKKSEYIGTVVDLGGDIVIEISETLVEKGVENRGLLGKLVKGVPGGIIGTPLEIYEAMKDIETTEKKGFEKTVYEQQRWGVAGATIYGDFIGGLLGGALIGGPVGAIGGAVFGGFGMGETVEYLSEQESRYGRYKYQPRTAIAFERHRQDLAKIKQLSNEPLRQK